MAHPRSTAPMAASSQAPFCWTSLAPEQTHAAARSLATCVGDEGLVLALVGPLGAGKTLFVQGLAEGLGIDPARVTSPTFVIAAEYPRSGDRRLHHVDLYRVQSNSELEQTGFLDLLEPGAVVAVEWADRFARALPPDQLVLTLERPRGGAAKAASTRALRALARGPVSTRVLDCWKRSPELAAGMHREAEAGHAREAVE